MNTNCGAYQKQTIAFLRNIIDKLISYFFQIMAQNNNRPSKKRTTLNMITNDLYTVSSLY